ncbi:ATP-dependent DNA helicase RecG [Candidatus Falkowbacteria bacterium CG23_combo_of_CG06-09_8_20_14_all_49_15]|uniref:Probable DNA 3'-5' helicase RecG n=1 Tax=Candidatus Falkowbacteria bacterium CG23_combo_of_CG06-09_8_20_14_all_49_15 TaxID=1974572 RepID=A0A2G9ZNQ1_9BACT|nr:MAG: ATP-dependent DNA helicase RecG [Candidatus Falkowbacteria bacterium CG23_combo_of_CG06-09_8_20_14_all_49_15]
MLDLNSPIADLNRVGKTTAGQLARLGIKTAAALLEYFPWRYDDYTRRTLIQDLRPGRPASIAGRLEIIQSRRSFRRRLHLTEAIIADQTGTVKIVWFNQPYLGQNLRIGEFISLAGPVEGEPGSPVMKSPVYEKISGLDEKAAPGLHTCGLVPNYHLTARLTQKQIRFLIKQAVSVTDHLPDWLPAEIIKIENFLPRAAAIRAVHFPANAAQLEKARQRLAFEELFLWQLKNISVRARWQNQPAEPIPFQSGLIKNFVRRLPFRLTDGQKLAAWKIFQDLDKDRPMARLVEGDVGCGKTVVALLAMLNAAAHQRQSVLLAPTEILARQHFETFKKLAGADSSLALLTGGQAVWRRPDEKSPDAKTGKKDLLRIIAQGETKIIIGTHALLNERVRFNRLGLAVIDEQHRFGVAQRQALVDKNGADGFCPHLLSLTATPIPRTLALSLYGDLDVSIIKDQPVGRKKIATFTVPEEKRSGAYRFIRQEIDRGGQAYIICPLVDFSDKLGVKSVKEEYEKLDKEIFADLSVAMVHGRLHAREKEKIMADFQAGRIKILVATAVVEVGVDAPAATVMMIEGADRFGLAQLHQFRGRVGRGLRQSYCLLFSDSQNDKTLERLALMSKYHDGFTLAQMDLKFRGPGEMFGTDQKGFPEMKVANLFDYALMKKARAWAEKLFAQDNHLSVWPRLAEKFASEDLDIHRE